MSFPLKPEAMALFVRCHKEGKLQFKPYYTARLAQIVTAAKRTKVDYAVGLEVQKLLDSRQRPTDGARAAYPILQEDVNRITRQVTMAVQSDIVSDDPNLLTFLPSDTALVAACFDPADTMSYADFRKAFPDYTEQMMADYLKACAVTEETRRSDDEAKGGSEVTDTAKAAGVGAGLRLTVGPLSLGGAGQAETAERTLDTIYNATGIKWAEGKTRGYYEPVEVKVYKLAEGYETRRLTQAGSITLSKGPLNSYLEESPFPQSYTAGVVDVSLKKTLEKNDHVTRLLKQKADLEKQRAEQVAKLAAAQAEQVKLLGGVATPPKDVQSRLTELVKNIPASQGEDAMRGIFNHIKAVWGWQPPGGIDRTVEDHVAARDDPKGPTRRELGNAAKQAIIDHKAGINASATSLGEAVAGTQKQAEQIDQSQKEIARLQAEIEKLDKEILAILER
ncbi:MAG: hypothetical protein K2X87_16305 [Gemmataceae bacterium]|nr:hypothetical protein [Gemmataceae bacterium]